MDWQILFVLAIVGVSAAYLLRAQWFALLGASGGACHTGCGSCRTNAPAEPETPGRIRLPQI